MKKKTNIEYEEKEENAFSLSTGDLMAGLLFIFILLLMGALLQVRERAEDDQKMVEEYQKVKTQLYIDLQKEFKDSLKTWSVTIDSSLSIRFQEPSMLFDWDESTLKPRFCAILNSFFPRYIEVLSREQYRDKIEEIRIEGHTDSSGEYFHNMELSQDRTRTVLQYCLKITPQEQRKWCIGLITANGLSSSHPILKNGKEDMNLSRRVEFRVRTNAEKQLEEIAARRANEMK
jgi:outer membrane protein OmpA-like peptidoglycan-associated protein